MFLYIITMIEPTDKLPAHQKEGGSFFLALGGLPGSEFAGGPWNKTQEEQVVSTVAQWYEYVPEKITAEHRAIRKAILEQSRGSEYLFYAEFNHHQKGKPSILMDDMGELYRLLKENCSSYNMTVTQFMSI